jgi:nitroreductase
VTSPADIQTTPSAVEVNNLKQAPKIDGVMAAFLHRWSPRSFADRDVSPETLAKVFEAARWAASSYNEQPWRFFVGMRGSSTWQKIFDALGEFNQAWAKAAPVLIVNAAHTRFSRNGTPNRVALYDLGAAASYMTLQASALGLAAHQMAGFDTEKARRALRIPEDYVMGAAIALGYQGEPAALPNEKLIQQEIAPRTRKPLDEIVLAEWDVPAKLG